MADIFDEIKSKRGGVASIHSVFKDYPQGVEAHFYFYEKILLGEGPLSRADREFLAVCTSQANECPYCVAHHQDVLNNQADIEPKRKEKLERFAKILTREPWKSQVEFLKLIHEGFSKPEAQHATMVVSYFNFVNRCVHALGLKLEDNFQDTCR